MRAFSDDLECGRTLRVALAPADYGGCGHYRMLWPEQAVAGTPWLETNVTTDVPILTSRDGKVVGVPDWKLDVFVLQRPIGRLLCQAIPFMKRAGTAVVVELDDDFELLHADHPSRRDVDPVRFPDANVLWLRRACDQADLLTAPTDALLHRYAPEGRGVLIRNYLPRWMLEASDRRDGRTLGWSGDPASHPGDLEEVGDAVAAVVSELDLRFQVVGPPDGVRDRLTLDRPVWGTGLVPIVEYGDALGGLDAAIVPLDPSAFNQAKSCLKGLEFAAAGVPFVASPTPEYVWLAEQGVGVLAYSPEDWYEQLHRLFADAEYRQRSAERARRIVKRKFLLRDHAGRWVDAWREARRFRSDERSLTTPPQQR